MLKIGDFSKLARVSIRMLRHYDEIGLLSPAATDAATGYRYYSEEQLPVIMRICALKDMGFGLAAIGELLDCYDDPEAISRYLTLKQLELQEDEREIQRRLQLLKSALTKFERNESTMKYDVITKTIPERYVASVRMVIPSYDKEYTLWSTMMTETASQHIQPAENCLGLAIFHDEGFKESDADVEIQSSVKGSYENTEHVIFKTVPPIEIASATYKGSYEQLTEVNLAVANWVRDNGYEFNGAMFCIYHVSPAQTQNPDELVTEVCYPVKRK